MKVSVVVISLTLLLFACVLYIQLNINQTEGFDTNICTPIKDTITCTKTADCNWDTASKTCLSCAELSGCSGCVDNNKCGWCTDLNKCVTADRMGLPIGVASGTCRDVKYVVTNEQCPANIVQQPTMPSNSNEPNIPLPVQAYSNTVCPDTDAIVATVKTKLGSNYIKDLVNAELKKNGIKTVEGFTGAEDGIALSVIGSISDDIRALVAKSIKK